MTITASSNIELHIIMSPVYERMTTKRCLCLFNCLITEQTSILNIRINFNRKNEENKDISYFSQLV